MKVTGITPILNVSSMKTSFDWFERLGWKKSWDWGNPATFGCVCAGNAEIFLCLDGQGGRGKGSNAGSFNDVDGETSDRGVWLSVWVDDVTAIHCLCTSNDIEILHEPEDMPWGVREMHIRHPDGHVFRLSQNLDS